MKKIVALAFLVFLAAGLWLEHSTGFFSGLMSPITVAVLDTGVDARIPALSSRLARAPGHNFFDHNGDLTDQSGHGTKVALHVVQACGSSECLILPVKMTRSGAGLAPKDLAEGIRFAVKNGARVINLSAGMSQGSDELADAVRDALASGVVIVTAAGNGIGNPFRAEPLSKVYPQTYPGVIVVGAARSLGEPDPSANYGPELDVVVTGQPAEESGSSYGAATVSGAIAAVLKTFPKAKPAAIRELLHATARRPSGAGESAGPSGRLGYGAFDPEAFAANRWRSMLGR